MGQRKTGLARLVAPALTMCGIAMAGDARAQDATSTTAPTSASASESFSYPPEFFARFAPVTALDMVEQLPDFLLRDTSSDRGLGEASQNVLINGSRVTGKSSDARSALRQISARSVVRIEMVDGATLGIPGLTGRVANVVVEQNQTRYQFRWEGHARPHIADQWTVGGIAASGRIGASDFTVSLSNSSGSRRGGIGPEWVSDATGSVLANGWQKDEFHTDNPRLNGTLHREWADGRVLNINLTAARDFTNVWQDSLTTPTDGSAAYDENYRRRLRDWEFEGGADYEFGLGGGRLKLIGLQRYYTARERSEQTTIDRAPGDYALLTRFATRYREGESVLRGEYSWGSDAASWQLSIEGAYNFSRNRSSYYREDLTADLPGQLSIFDPVFVNEWRSEALITHGRTLAQGLTVQLTAGGEFSRIRADVGNVGHIERLTRHYWRPKGSVALAWVANPALTINASVRRKVGQLSFSDFGSAVDIINNVTTTGNVRLVPEQSWRFEVEAIRKLGSAGQITLTGYHEWISDIVDRIPLSPTEEAIGNLSHARRYGVSARGTVTLDSLGWKGGRINARGEYRQSRVTDPVTGVDRRISGDLIHSWSVELRHDIAGTPLAWGAIAGDDRNEGTFRLDQYYASRLNRPVLQLYAEHKDVLGMTMRLTLRNLSKAYEVIARDVYADRRNGPLAYREVQHRSLGLIGVLTISGQF